VAFTRTGWQIQPSPAAVAWKGSRECDAWRVLVVEDDQGVREVISAMLEDGGHHVVCAANAAEATRLFAAGADGLSSAAPFDIAIIDLVVPGRHGGADLARSLRADGSAGIVVLISGHPERLAEARRDGWADAWLETSRSPSRCCG
jgi:CheY-like chemotaxis protein